MSYIESLPINLPAIPHPHHQNTQGAIFDAGDNAAVANAVFPAGVGRNSEAYCAECQCSRPMRRVTLR